MTDKILVVEDEPASLRILQYFLTQEGYDTASARDGIEAVKLLTQCRFDLVVSDIKMPRMDGVALARHILSLTPITPIFLISANVSDYFGDILKLGVPYLSKPVLLNQLLAQVQKLLGHQGSPNSQVRRLGQ